MNKQIYIYIYITSAHSVLLVIVFKFKRHVISEIFVLKLMNLIERLSKENFSLEIILVSKLFFNQSYEDIADLGST